MDGSPSFLKSFRGLKEGQRENCIKVVGRDN